MDRWLGKISLVDEGRAREGAPLFFVIEKKFETCLVH